MKNQKAKSYNVLKKIKLFNYLKKIFKMDKKVIIKVDGGFGSTISQYALGRLFKKFGYNTKYDLSWFDYSGKDCDNKLSRKFELLNVFPNLDLKVSTKIETKFFKKFFYFKNEETYIYNPSVFEKEYLYADGYYAHWQYFYPVREELVKDFDFSLLKLNSKNQEYLDEINNTENAIGIHVRRGDYVNIGACILTPSYYISAINYMIENLKSNKLHFYFFSDDMNWVRENIANELGDNISFSCVEANDNDSGYIDFYLMSKCKHQILSNSSFSFWSAFLSQNIDKIVIIPDIWTLDNNSKGSETAFVIPGWITIPPSYSGIQV